MNLTELMYAIEDRFTCCVGPAQAFITLPDGKHYYQVLAFSCNPRDDETAFAQLFSAFLDALPATPVGQPLYWRVMPTITQDWSTGRFSIRARLVIPGYTVGNTVEGDAPVEL